MSMGIKVVDAKMMNVSPKLYRVIRSFLDSSLKSKYEWNVGVHIQDFIIFEKPEKWVLRIEKEEGGGYIITLESSNKLTNIKLFINNDTDRLEINDICGTMTIHDPYKSSLEGTFVVSKKKLPFSEPIYLADILNKLLLYYEISKTHFDECKEKDKEGK